MYQRIGTMVLLCVLPLVGGCGSFGSTVIDSARQAAEDAVVQTVEATVQQALSQALSQALVLEDGPFPFIDALIGLSQQASEADSASDEISGS